MNVSPVLPWDLTPALEQSRLVTLARVAVATRNKAFAEADRDAGDTNWGLACKAHERLMFALERLSAEHPWLRVVREGLYVMPLVDDVPVRLYRGAPDRPGSRHLEAVRLEHERSGPAQPQMAFDFMGGSDDGPWYWLMAMETDPAGMVSRVVFVQANDAGETRHPWECPLEAVREPAAIPPPTVELVQPEAATMGGDPPYPLAQPVTTGGDPQPVPTRRARRAGRAALAVAPVTGSDSRQEELWDTALGAE
jgi:hypothetical protein